jgi:hypothetical protein
MHLFSTFFQQAKEIQRQQRLMYQQTVVRSFSSFLNDTLRQKLIFSYFSVEFCFEIKV